jgi:hypothetical protein
MSVHIYKKMTLILNIALPQSESIYKESYDVINVLVIGARYFLSVDKSVDMSNSDSSIM